MLSFKKKSTLPTEIISSIDKLTTDLISLKKNKQFQPSQDDLKDLQRVCEQLHHAYGVAGYVSVAMQKRYEGKPEGAARFNNEEVFEYHFPGS